MEGGAAARLSERPHHMLDFAKTYQLQTRQPIAQAMERWLTLMIGSILLISAVLLVIGVMTPFTALLASAVAIAHLVGFKIQFGRWSRGDL